MNKKLRALFPYLLMCLTLGLAPFIPEPHIWGKLKWIAGGANGMVGKDWFDFLLHGSPFIAFTVKWISISFKVS